MHTKLYLTIAREAILSVFEKSEIDVRALLEAYPELSESRATFVTLTLNGQLRGCIGSLIAHKSLVEDLISNARSAAFRDPRFSPLTPEEFSEIKIEVSLLTVPILLVYTSREDLKDLIVPGQDGVILRHGNHQATFLPQVWDELPDFNHFFEHLGEKRELGPIRSLISRRFIPIRLKNIRKNLMTKRGMSVGGSFYPANADEIIHMIDHFNAVLESHADVMQDFNALRGRSIIVPHAGWIYSGFTANIAFRLLANVRPKTVIIIGPSHRVGFDGVSIADAELYETPLGDIKIDRHLLEDLRQRFKLPYFKEAHHEHSTEVQMPFIKHYMGDAQVIELVYAYAQPTQIALIIDYALSLPDTAIVISTDLSHYYSLDKAKQLDTICLEAIQNEKSEILHQGCEACGMIGVEAMLTVAKKRGLESIILDYRTSADASGDTTRVVGYGSALFS